MSTRLGSLALIGLLIPGSWGPARAGEPSSPPDWSGTLQPPDGRRLAGKLLIDDTSSVVRFAVDGSGSALPIEKGAVVTFDGPGPEPTAGSPPFQVDLGLGRRISGRLGLVDGKQVRLDESSAGGRVSIARSGVRSVVQRLGEMQIFDDGFETLNGKRWVLIGDPEIANEPKMAGEHSLRIPAGGTSVTRRLDEPVAAGRLELAFYDSGAIEPDQHCFVDLLFRSPADPVTVRVILGWSEESLSVESPGGPALAVQRLARKAGWHRLSLRFGPEQTEIAVDGNDLAHGKGPGGSLVEVRLATSNAGRGPAPNGLKAYFDDLRLVRFSEGGMGLEVDPTQDEIRLSGGDQVFGTIVQADAGAIKLRVDPNEIQMPWSEVAGLQFRRVAGQSEPIDGTWLRIDWRAAPGDDPLDLDRIDGALVSHTATGLTLEVPFVGRFTVARNRLRRLEVLGRGRRIVVDATAHHLGNEIVASPLPLDPPQPEGRTLERAIELADVPPGAAFLSLDVVQVAGESAGLPFFSFVKDGEIRTNVSINGRPFDYLNRHITSKNETAERIQLPIPAGLLHPGRNLLRIDQIGTKLDPNNLDDLGVLEIAVEFPHDRAVPAATEKP
ncbi:hypothetical protein SAMN05444166_6654 [Singulisphaera sp. GP187]|uniref:hypothetical protein n=1 Tax=Singulisphaera sp. GP187 TaxID=1882752 RepID=UPI0009282758|nr:hypothetical protein [Singulisphaera sp. GP187]SIO61140.1 hypothetical protein SAMN05444166_6654 [Singulisphaera sp. GP187]